MLHYIIKLHTDGGRRKGTDDGTKRDRQNEKEEKEEKGKKKERKRTGFPLSSLFWSSVTHVYKPTIPPKHHPIIRPTN